MNNQYRLLAGVLLFTTCTSLMAAVNEVPLFSLTTEKLSQQAAKENHFLAYENKQLTPSQTVMLHHHSPLTHTFFVIADDQHSKQWLQRQRGKLIALDAVGLLVSAKDAASIKQITALVPQLTVYAVSAPWVVKAFGLKHYPAVISPIRSKQ